MIAEVAGYGSVSRHFFPDVCVSAAQRPAQLDPPARHLVTRPVIKLKSDDDSFDYATALAVSLFH
jgi:hypothetical protein